MCGFSSTIIIFANSAPLQDKWNKIKLIEQRSGKLRLLERKYGHEWNVPKVSSNKIGKYLDGMKKLDEKRE